MAKFIQKQKISQEAMFWISSQDQNMEHLIMQLLTHKEWKMVLLANKNGCQKYLAQWAGEKTTNLKDLIISHLMDQTILMIKLLLNLQDGNLMSQFGTSQAQSQHLTTLT